MLLLLATLFLSSCGGDLGITTASATPTGATSTPEQKAGTTPVSQLTVTVTATATTVPTIQPTTGPTRLGSSFNNFVGRFGQPTVNQSSPNLLYDFTDSQDNVILEVRPNGDGNVVALGLQYMSGAWDAMVEQRACESFFPTATQFVSQSGDVYTFTSDATGPFTYEPTATNCTMVLEGS